MDSYHMLNTSSVATNENCSTQRNTSTEKRMVFAGNTALRITEDIELYGVFVLVPLGVVFNLISLLIFCRHSTYRSAIGIHLKCLAVADTLVITAVFISKLGDSNFIQIDLVLCKINVFFLSVGVPWSGMLLSSATIERFVSIAFALKVKKWNLFGISFLCNITYIAITISYAAVGTKINGDFICGIVKETTQASEYYNFIGNSIVLFTFSGVTFNFTVLIAIFLFLHSRRRRALVHNHDSQSNKEFQISLMLFIVATLFLVLRFPRLVAFQIRYFYGSRQLLTDKLLTNTIIAWPISNLLLVINHSINFVIYMIFLKSFRHQFWTMLMCQKIAHRETSVFITIQSTTLSLGK